MIDVSISWDRLERNSESKEISFESFNFQVAYLLYSKFGDFEYDYNTPGSEFYLHLNRDCPELKASAGQIVGWQAKFWLNRTDPDNTSLTESRRDELAKGLAKSKEYKPKLATWVICIPGQPLNTRPHRPKDALLAELAKVDPDISILFWHKPLYEAYLHYNYEKLSPLFWHYFGQHFLGLDICKRRTEATLNSLKERFDIELYVRGSGDDEIWRLIHLDRSLSSLNACITELRRHLSVVEDKPEPTRDCDADLKEHESALKELRVLSINLAKELLDYDDRLNTLSQTSALVSLYSTKWGDIIDAYRRAEEATPDGRSLFWPAWELRELLGGLVAVRDQLYNLFQNHVHVLSPAGYGKTCLACHIASKCLDQDIPAILLTGRLLSDNTPITSQIISRLGLPSSWTLRNVFACLNNLGFLKRKKVPIIIDGLNETVPNCSRWREELNELIFLAKEFRHVILITTVRTAYCERIFGVSKSEEIDNAIVLQGFTDYNINYAVSRYFEKYNIVATNWSTNHKIFTHPLLLKMFCIVNEYSNVEISHASVFAAIEQYVDHLTKKAVTTAGDVNRFLLPILDQRIKDLAKHLWESNSRSIDYMTALPGILDPEWNGSGDWRQTNSCRLMDEGMFLTREIRHGEEVVEFSYDLVAGVVIAKSVFFSGDRPPIDILATNEALQRLGNGNREPTHPLSEDIIRALIYLWPKYCDGTQLIQVFEHPDCIKFSFEMLDVICATDSGKAAVKEKVLMLPRPSDELRFFSEGVIDSVLDHGSLSAIVILSELLLELTAPEIDLVWSEAIRARQQAVLAWLSNLKSEAIPEESKVLVLTFLAMLCSSTFRILRDKALLALVQLGRMGSDALLEVLKNLAPISDAYVLEGVTAALCGVALRSQDTEEVGPIRKLLRESFVPELRFPSVLILDYLDTIFAHAAHLTNEGYDDSWLKVITRCSWQVDRIAEAECTEERAEWGYGPIDYDFANTYLSYLIYDSDYNLVSTKKEITCKMIYRMKEHGYDLARFAELDKRIAKESESERHYYSRYIESYCRKISWITFHELMGQMLLDGTLQADLGRFRLLHENVDPTLPRKPHKRQLFTRCCVACQSEPIEDWVNRSKKLPYFDDLRVFKMESEDDTVWVLIYGELKQSGRNKSKLYVWWRTQFCTRGHEDGLVERLCSRGVYPNITKWDKVMAGEIPWRFGLYPTAKDDEEEPFDNIEDIVEFYSWGSGREVIGDIGIVPLLHHRIALTCHLQFNPDGMSFIDNNGYDLTKIFWDNTSMFMYARKDFLQSYCEANNYTIVWLEHGFRYGIRDGGKEYADELRKDFCLTGTFEI